MIKSKSPFVQDQYDQLLRSVETNPDGSVNFYDVMKVIGVDVTVEDNGVSNRIAAESQEVEEKRIVQHQTKLEVSSQRTKNHTKLLSANDVLHLLWVSMKRI